LLDSVYFSHLYAHIQLFIAAFQDNRGKPVPECWTILGSAAAGDGDGVGEKPSITPACQHSTDDPFDRRLMVSLYLQCSDTVGWVTGRASGL